MGPIPVTVQSKAWVFGRSVAGDCGFESRRELGCLSLESVVLSRTVICVGLIAPPEESY